MADLGIALSCVSDIDPAGRVVTGNMVVGQALARRLSTPRGRLIGSPNYGEDLTQYVNADMSPRDIAALRARTQAECLKDPRVLSATVQAVLGATGILTVTILVDIGEGPFTLVLAVSSVTVELLSVTP